MLRNREVILFAKAYKRGGGGTATINQFVEAASNFLIHFVLTKGFTALHRLKLASRYKYSARYS
jgi:hypothetical protein